MIVPVLFGLEALASREIKRLGYEVSAVEDGKITFLGDWEAVCRANLWLRTGERVLIKVAQFTAKTFEELFEQTKQIDWSLWIGREDAFPVKGHCLKSQLASVRDCQAIIKKAAAVSLSERYGVEWMAESGTQYQIQFSVMKDIVTLMIDTSGESLHKRGYRKNANGAPLRETIAAAMVMLSHWKYELPMADPFCGSGTIPIEAAMFKRNIAPGLQRRFAAEQFGQIPASLWQKCRDEALQQKRDLPLTIYASDIDPECVALTEQNARLAGVADAVKPICAEAQNFMCEQSYGTMICNPPYGERLSDIKSCEHMYQQIGKQFSALKDWSFYILASHEQFEHFFGRKADKKRKIYNGMLKCNVYQYFGAKPSKEYLEQIKIEKD